MDDLQILVKAIVDDNSESSMDSELSGLVKRLESKHKIELGVGLEDSSVQVVQTQLQAIAKQVSSANKNGNTLQVFDTTQLQADGRKYFASTKTLVADVQKEFQSLGKVDVTNVFKNAKGDIQSFTASVTKADGTIEKFNFSLAQIKDGTRTLRGFVQASSSLTDKNMGSGLSKTLDYLNRIENRISTIKSKTLTDTAKPLTADMKEYSQFETELTKVSNRIAEIRNQNSAMTSEQKREIDTLVSGLQRYGRELQKTAYAANDLAAKTFANRKSELQDALKTDIEKWNLSGVFTGDFKKSVEEAKSILDNAFDQKGLDDYKHKLYLIRQEFKQFNLLRDSKNKEVSQNTLSVNIQNAQERLINLRKLYSKFVNDPKLLSRWNDLFKLSGEVDSQKKLTELNAEIRLFEKQLISAGKHAKSFYDELTANASKMATWLILGGFLSSVIRGFTGLYDAVVEVDTAMVELKKVTNDTKEAYDSFLTSAAKNAVDIGASYSDMITSTAGFARLGYALEDAQRLAEIANIYAVVGDGVDNVETATSSIISTMKAFNITVDDAITIVDKYNEVGNNFAISSGGIGDALARSASAMASANNTLDESIALIVAANNVIQDPDVVGNMWKTVSMRIRGAKTELEDAGLETEYMAESTASLRKQILALTNVDGYGGFDIMQDEDSFKSTYDIVLGISKVWKKISDIDQAALLELLAGKRQGNALASAINNMDDAVKVLQTSVDAEGSAIAEHEKYMESVHAKQEQFQAQYQALANTVLDSKLITGGFNVGTGILGWLTKLVDVIGPLPVMIAAISPFFNKLQKFATTTDKNWFGSGLGISTKKKAQKLIDEKDNELIDEYIKRLKNLGSEQNNLQSKQIVWNDTIGKGSSELKNMVEVSVDATEASNAYKLSMEQTSDGINKIGLKSKIAAIGVQTLDVALNALVDVAITMAFQLLFSLVTKLINYAKEARQAMMEAGRAASESAAELSNLARSYLELSYAVENGTAAQEDLDAIQDDLIQHLDEQGVAVQNLTGDYKALRTAMIDAVQEGLSVDLAKALAGAASSTQEAIKEITTALGEHSYVSVAGEGSKEALKYLESLGYSSDISMGAFDGGTVYLPNSTMWGMDDAVTLEEIIENRAYLERAMQDVQKKFGAKNPLAIALSNMYTSYDNALKDTIADIQNANELIADNALLELRKNGEPETLEDFIKLRESVIKATGEHIDFDVLGGKTAEETVDAVLAQNASYKTLLSKLHQQEAMQEEVLKKREFILNKLIPQDPVNIPFDQYLSKRELLNDELEKLSGGELSAAYDAASVGAESWNDIVSAVEKYNAEQAFLQSNAGKLRTSLGELWSSEEFEETRAELTKLANTAVGISPDSIVELVDESEGLSDVLKQDGMNAQFLAKVLETMASGGDGLSLITEEALAINKALDGMVGSFERVSEAKERYDAALSVEEKDSNFKSYAEAFEALNAQFEAGTTNSNAFWAAAEFLFGGEQLESWGWSDGLEEIRRAMLENKSVFEDADSAGTGFIERLYEMSEAGLLVSKSGEKLINIAKSADGAFKFDVDPENIGEIARQMNLTEEAVLSCFKALSMWGNVDFYDVSEVIAELQDAKIAAETVNGVAINVYKLIDQLIALGKTEKEIHDVMSALTSTDGVTLLGVTENVNDLMLSLKNLGLIADDGVSVSVDYKSLANLMAQIGLTKEEADELITSLAAVNNLSWKSADGEIKAFGEVLKYIDSITFKNVSESTEDISVSTNNAQSFVNDLKSAIKDVDALSTDNITSEITQISGAVYNAIDRVTSLNDAIRQLNGQTAQINFEYGVKPRLLGMFGFANGTKHAPAGKALVGEDGAELWQSEDKARLVGVDGPEIVDLNEGDRIYTNEQTRKIFGSSGKRMTGTISAYRNGLRNDFEKVNWALIGDDGDVVEVPAGGISGEVTIKPKPDESNTGDGGNSNRVSNEFENLYKKHQHLLAMDQESQEEYLAWLRDAYQKAYKDGEIELDDYYQYQEEVYHGLQDLFRDYIGDNEHLIDMLSHYDHTDGQIISIYQSMMAEIQKEISAARASGMDDSDEYIQELQKKWMDYFDSVDEIYDKTTDSAKEAVDELVDYRIDMIKQELESERDALDAKLDYLRDFYDKQKELLQDQSDNDRYLRDQQEKRRAVSDIQEDLDRIRFDDSAWAQRRKLELQEELAEAQRELKDFEDDHALDLALKALDDAYGSQEKNMQAEMDALEEKLNDPNALYNRALEEIKNTSKDQLYYQMLMYNRQYGDGKDETVIELWESAFGALDDYSRLFGELYKGIELSNETGITENGNSWDTSPISGTNPENQKSDASSAEVKPVLEEGVQITVKHSATHFGSNSANKRIDGAVPGGEYTVYQIDDDEVLIGRDGVYAGWIKKSDIVGYAKGTKYASAGLHRFNEKGSEYIFADQGGGKYRMFSEGEKVLDAESSSWLHGFATSRGKSVVDKILASFHNAGDEIVNRIVGSHRGLGDGIARMLQSAADNRTINIDASGDTIIQGNANEKTVSEIRREKRERIDDMLSAFNRLRKQW